MLQSLYGHTATDAGLVLGPGASSSWRLLAGRENLAESWNKPLIFTDTLFLALPCGATPASTGTDYKHVRSPVRSRAWDCPLFVPVSTGLSFLPKNKKKSFKSDQSVPEPRGSVGIAFRYNRSCASNAVSQSSWSLTPLHSTALPGNTRHFVAIFCDARFTTRTRLCTQKRNWRE